MYKPFQINFQKQSMKHLIFGTLSFFLLVSMSAPALRAQTPSGNASDSPAPSAPSADADVSPFDLVTLAYQGFLKDQNIPSGDSFMTAYHTKNITAEDLVKAAIEANRLSPRYLNDSEYLADVESQLNGLSSGMNRR